VARTAALRRRKPGITGGDPEGADHAVAASGQRRRARRLLAAVLLPLALVTALLAFGLTRDPTVITSPLIGRRAPDFTLRSQDGSSVTLSDLRGHVVLVNFWASWCTACHEEHQDLIAAWNRYRDRGVVLLGVLYQDSPSSAAAFMRDNGGDWPVLQDPGGEVSLAYGVYGAPETFFIAPDGTIVDKRVGASSFDLLSAHINGLLDRETV
jgi:cytochrome c biogenesis protein CcmG, thiol:disulfide interchange protein DsbE